MSTDLDALHELDRRLKIVLPEQYQASYETLEPAAMKSAGLKFAADGTVAWDEIWGSFCDLAMAGGPPHKGTLLEPGRPHAIDAAPDRHHEVVEEIRRGIMMVTDLLAFEGRPGWVRVKCDSREMCAWLLRAIVMENVAARGDGMTLELPAAPHFRIEKEIKNVITAIAKTCHYWVGHVPREQKRAIAELFGDLETTFPLLRPDADVDGAGVSVVPSVASRITELTGLEPSPHTYASWIGIECPTVAAATWMMRAMVVQNVLSRREGTTLFVPLDRVTDPTGVQVITRLAYVHRLARRRGVV